MVKPVAGLEALLRLQSQKRGMVTPENFIYILEETGMIVNIVPVCKAIKSRRC